MNWETKDNTREPVTREISERLDLTKEAHVSIDYQPYTSACIYLAMPYDARKAIDVNDREGTRRIVLRELLPLAEAALQSLRQAVAEFDPPTLTRFDGQTRPAVVEIPDVDENVIAGRHVAQHEPAIDMVGFANDLLRGKP